MPSIKDRLVSGAVKVRSSFFYLWAFVFLTVTWIVINKTGLVHWDNDDLVYLNLTISILTEANSVALLLFVSKMDEQSRLAAERDRQNIKEQIELARLANEQSQAILHQLEVLEQRLPLP